ncbi:Sde2 N-terminal domain-containing protein [Artemisia annua]|uniref:Sde2 N-terminal domain-containing protein n=1 Tax=Artemisia annua TaxID=35608 RepID=A0A2U1QFR8_ARTAN|nr:Sde2 N-terminal domain-containing protein [Artemisia annua]
MEQTQLSESTIYQIITKLLDGKSQTLNFNTPIIPISLIKSKLQTLTSIPTVHQLLVSNGKTLYDDDVVSPKAATVHLLLRLRGGKGGFGSLLRGAATKAGQKKTNNFDACRDMSGRRLRHVNAEKKMEEWLAEEKERKLEKVAEDFLKKNAKSVKKKGGGDGAEKYVEKYRKDSAKCMEDVEKSVRESLSGAFSKRKGLEGEDGGASKSKKLKIWMGKRKADDSDSDDMDEEDSDDEMGVENEKSGVTNNENRSDSNKEPNGSLASVNGGKVEGESSVGCSSESASEEEKETVIEEQLGSINESNDKGVDASVGHEESTVNNVDDSTVSFEMEKLAKPELNDKEKQTELPISSNVQQVETTDVEANSADAKEVINEEKVSTNSNCPELEKPLNFDEFNSAAEMEVLGMERLKSELQERGLKCGGTLQERAARLFLLKTIPLEMLPKKLLTKK